MSMVRRQWLIALAIPLVGLGATWAMTDRGARAGTDWLVPVEGYDPRDLLRGHYIEFRYAWPGLDERRKRGLDVFDRYASALCIEGLAPDVRRVTVIRAQAGEGRPARCDSVARVSAWADGWHDGIAGDRLYIAQSRAAAMERDLRDPAKRALVRVRVRDDGLVRPLGIQFQPR